uniref:Uncharacterized protein n=1 Tax=Anguilla anguilla TaxID=7936 RepID=A0A0E9Y1G5_ANGAN
MNNGRPLCPVGVAVTARQQIARHTTAFVRSDKYCDNVSDPIK